MDICCYIIYSPTLRRFYTGACRDSLDNRIFNHNSHKYGNHRFTATVADWELFLKIEAIDYPQAVRIERKIKSMKSSVYIQNLKKYPELRSKLFLQTQK